MAHEGFSICIKIDRTAARLCPRASSGSRMCEEVLALLLKRHLVAGHGIACERVVCDRVRLCSPPHPSTRIEHQLRILRVRVVRGGTVPSPIARRRVRGEPYRERPRHSHELVHAVATAATAALLCGGCTTRASRASFR